MKRPPIITKRDRKALERWRVENMNIVAEIMDERGESAGLSESIHSYNVFHTTDPDGSLCASTELYHVWSSEYRTIQKTYTPGYKRK